MKFEGVSKFAEIHEETEKIIEYREVLKDYLKDEAENLRKAGFGVDDECRIKPNEFKNLFGAENVNRDLKWLEEKKAKFEKETPEKIKSEVLEMAKTFVFNNKWFDKKLIAVRTSEYDDVAKGVDQLIFDSETKMTLAAIDTTANWKDKKDDVGKAIETGATVKYGFGFEDGGWQKKSYYNLPLFIIPIKNEDLLEILKNIEKEESNYEERLIQNKILEELKFQSENFAQTASPKLKSAYEKAGEIFEKL